MSHNSLIAEIETWLLGKALGDPEIVALFEALCQRLHGVGIPVERAVLSWPTLHPLFRAEQVFWWLGKGAKLEQYYHSNAGNADWLKSPFHRMQSRNLPRLRRRLTGENAFLDFDVLKDFAAQGYTDYLLTSSRFGIADFTKFADGPTGIMASWTTSRPGGFTDMDLDALSRIQTVFAVACRAAIQKRVMANLATAYLGPTAGWRVLAGDIQRGDGDHIPAVVWFSDMRGSTRLSDTMDPDDYLALLNRYFECTAAPVISHGGEILNFIGDGVLAIFPVGKDEDAAAAARRATSAAGQAVELQAQAIANGTPAEAPLDFGIGLDIGELKFGNIGVPERLAFSGIGRVVNGVQRIEAATKDMGHQVLATGKVAEAVPDQWVSAGQRCLADFQSKVELFTYRAAEAKAAE
ncbi:MAG: adenylate/guanylate cyclase domain-containing protein [Paracoccaceae bacterium]|nr:adenylate/guanylate cyclase domain-containing protein [Paracoccaceae bacterium]